MCSAMWAARCDACVIAERHGGAGEQGKCRERLTLHGLEVVIGGWSEHGGVIGAQDRWRDEDLKALEGCALAHQGAQRGVARHATAQHDALRVALCGSGERLHDQHIHHSALE